MRASAGGLLLCLFLSGCGRYADFTLPQPASANAQVRYRWQPRESPVLTHGDVGSWDSHDVLNPSIVRRQSGYYNLYSGFDGRIWRTGLATSADGLIWHKEGPVLAPDAQAGEGDYIAANGAALLDGDQFWYWYQAGDKEMPRLGLARAHDARHWRKSPFPVMDTGPRGSWDERGVADPYVIKVQGYFYLYYLGQDRAHRQRLGVARSRDGEHWEKLRTNPILEPGPYGSFDEMGLGEPAVWIGYGYYWMLYTGRDARENRRLGMARSSDGVHWQKLATVMAGPPPWAGKVICDPTIEVLDGTLAVWFGGGDRASPDENLDGQIGVAVLEAVESGKMK
ncbi:MAG TPA: hypothetical protein VMI94_10490 [Bryobacteraceae bacterium]|nr:hypothetical protein [Bryobacteraceae bacterium]